MGLIFWPWKGPLGMTDKKSNIYKEDTAKWDVRQTDRKMQGIDLHWQPYPSYAPLTILLLSKRMHLTNSSWPSNTRKHAPHSISHSLEESTKQH